MEIEEAIDIIDKELHKKWDKTIEKKDGKTYIHLGDEEPLNEFEKASQRCLVEVQSLNRKTERLNNIINDLEKWLEVNLINLEKEKANNIYDKGLKQGMLSNGRLIKNKLQELKGVDKE